MIPPHLEDMEPSPFGISPTVVEDTHNELDEIGKLLADAEIAVMSNAIDKLSEIEAECSKIEAKLIGRIGVGLDEIEAACNKVRAKTTNKITSTAGQMYEYMGAAGIPFPGMDEVKATLGLPAGTDAAFVGETKPEFLASQQPSPGVQVTGTEPQPTVTDTQPPPVDGTQDQTTAVPPADERGNVTVPPFIGGGNLCTVNPGGSIPFIANGFGVISSGVVETIGQAVWGDVGGVSTVSPWISMSGMSPGMKADCLSLNVQSAYWWKPGTGQYSPTVIVPSGWGLYLGQSGHLVAAPKPPAGYCQLLGVSGGQCPTGGGTLTNIPTPPKPTTQPPCVQCCCNPCQCQGQQASPKPVEKPKPPEDDKPQAPPAPEPINQGDDICKAIQDSIDRMGLNVNPPVAGEGGATVGATVGGFDIQLGDKVDEKQKGVVDGVLESLSEWATKAISDGVNGLDCQRAKLLFISLFRAGFMFVHRWTGMVPPQIMEQTEILSRTICQSRLPGGGMADVAYLRGDIDRATWECFHKAEGNHIGPAEKVMMAGRAKLDPMQLDRLNRRKKIPDAELDQLMREAGVMKKEDQKRIHDWNEQFPTHSEVITLMNRDVVDEQNVDWTEADKLFQQNYKDKVKDWFDANGLDEQTAKYFWRGHFHIPSYTMGQQFLFRKREGKDGVTKPFTRDDFRKMLVQDDWHPGFIDHMIDVSYRVPTRRDILMAFMLHTIKDEEFKGFLQDWGYKEEGADFFLNLYKVKRQIADVKAAGYPTLKQLANTFAQCLMSEQEFKDASAILVVDSEQQDEAVKAAELTRTLWQRKQAVAAIRKPYLLGLLDGNDVRDRLTQAGLTGSCQDEYIANWDLLAARQDKTESASQLCGMLESGVVQPAQFVDALVRQHWDAESALRMLQQCEYKIDQKQQRKAEALARRIQAEQRRAAKEAEKLRRLQECGPPACPTNTPGGQKPKPADPQNQGPSSNGTVPTNPPG